MTFSITGLAYLIASFTFGFLAYRFFQYWKKEKTIVAKLFFYFAAVFVFFFFGCAIPILFFAQNSLVLKGVVVGSAFLEGFACAFLGYMIFYLYLPKISPRIGFSIPLILGTAAAVLSALAHFEVFLEPGGAINWGDQGLANVFRNLVYIATFVPMTVVIFSQYRKNEGPYDRARALGLASFFVFGVISVPFDYGLEKAFGLPAITSDIVMCIASLFISFFLLLTQKSPLDYKENLPPGYTKSVR